MKNKYLDWSKFDDLQKNQIEILLPNELENKNDEKCIYLSFSKTRYELYRNYRDEETEATYEEFKASLFNPKRGDMVLVSNNLIDWDRRIFLIEDIQASYPIVHYENEFKSNKRYSLITRKYMKPFIKEITKAEIQEKFNCTEFKIVE